MLKLLIKHILPNNIATYLINSLHFKRYYPDSFNLWYLMRIFPKWLINLNGNSLKDEIPWISFSAISFLKKNIKPNMQIYEFGSGGSTLFFSKYTCNVISVEHNKKWYALMSKAIRSKGYNNCNIRLIEPTSCEDTINKDFSNPDHYKSSCKEFIDKSFIEYARSIEDYPDNYFDIVLIDGRARPSCIKHSINKIKEKGFLILDDSERKYYLDYFKFKFLNFTKLFDKTYIFYGPSPYCRPFKETTIWQKYFNNA